MYKINIGILFLLLVFGVQLIAQNGNVNNSLYGNFIASNTVLNSSGHSIQGIVYWDNSINCIQDAAEPGLEHWIVEIARGSDKSYATTNSSGYFSARVDSGNYMIRAIPPNDLWGFCIDSFEVLSDTITNLDTIRFGMQTLKACPVMHVDISTPILRRCSSSVYTLNYCNKGTVDATNAYVEVDIDTILSVTSSSIPFSGPLSGVYTFNLGTIPPGGCGNFTIDLTVSCSVGFEVIHCVKAHIFPDSNCISTIPLWDQSDIDVDGICYGDSIEFIIKNIGLGNMGAMRQYFVTEDHVMLFTTPFQLNAGDSIIQVVPTSGAVYRLQAEEDPNHPYSSYSAYSITMCTGVGFTINGLVGVISQYAEDDEHPAISIDCQQNVDSWSALNKRAAPVGYNTDHYIEQTTDLEYHIRFQNTGTDTVTNVIVIDSLSGFLNPPTVVPGAGSHPYSFELKDNGVLIFNFDNIMLPDSATDEAASHGFIKFRIQQNDLNPIGTVINNKAWIGFDSNSPVPTNITFHTVGEGFIVYVKKIGGLPSTKINIFPNPFTYQATIDVEGELFEKLELHIIDAMGREVQYQQADYKQQIIIKRKGMNPGVYFFQLKGDGTLIGAGKIIVN